MVEEFRKMLSEVVGVDIESIDFKKAYEKDGIETDFVVKMMICSRLERIADVLEDINSTLISMSAPVEQLSECVGYAPPRHYQKQGYNFLRIAGQVDTD